MHGTWARLPFVPIEMQSPRPRFNPTPSALALAVQRQSHYTTAGQKFRLYNRSCKASFPRERSTTRILKKGLVVAKTECVVRGGDLPFVPRGSLPLLDQRLQATFLSCLLPYKRQGFT